MHGQVLHFLRNCASETQTIRAFWRKYIKSEKLLYSLRSDKSVSEWGGGEGRSVDYFFQCTLPIIISISSRYSRHTKSNLLFSLQSAL